MKTAISMPDDLYRAVIDYADGKKFSTTVCNLIRLALEQGKKVVLPIHTEVIPPDVSAILSRITEIESAVNQNKESIQGALHQIVEIQSREKYAVNDLDKFDERFQSLESNLSFTTSQMTNLQGWEVNSMKNYEALLQRVDDLTSKESAISRALPHLGDIITEIDAINVRLSRLEGKAPGKCSLDALADEAKDAEDRINVELITNAVSMPDQSMAEVKPEVILDEKITLTEEMRLALKEKIDALRKNGKTYAEISLLTGIGESPLKKLGNGYPVKLVSKRGYDILCINSW